MPVRFYPYIPIESLENIIQKEDGSPQQGEIDIYRKLHDDLGSSNIDWDIWHDLKLPEHSDSFNYYKKTSAQIDFLILCNEGIIIMEVKGGAISTKENKFYYGRNFNEEMSQNPFKQAEGYKYTLKDNILNTLKKTIFCEVVAFPHVNYSFDSKLIDKNILWSNFTSKDFDNSLEKFLLNVLTKTKEKHKKYNRTYSVLSSKDVASVRNILSPIIEDRNRYCQINTLKWLGIQNSEILDSLYRNQRIMLEGPPGSGKTTLAKAFIDKQQGKRGIYVCWNNLLMHYTKHILEERESTSQVEVTTFFRFFQKSNPHISYEELINLNENQFYDLVRTTLKRTDETNIQSYDFIVIDEGQDIFDRGLDLFINQLCGHSKKGLTNGNALILYDIDQSYAFSGRNVTEIADLLTEYFSHFRLNEVRRSVQNPDIRKLSTAILENPMELLKNTFNKDYPCISIFKRDSLEQVKKNLIQNTLSSIRSGNSSLKGEDCILLIESNLLKGSYKGAPDMHYELVVKDIEELTESNVSDKANKLFYTSILKYKGLEKKNVILVITEPSEINKYEIFIGITRAICNVDIYIVS